jgi:hypothetical protein
VTAVARTLAITIVKEKYNATQRTPPSDVPMHSPNFSVFLLAILIHIPNSHDAAIHSFPTELPILAFSLRVLRVARGPPR